MLQLNIYQLQQQNIELLYFIVNNFLMKSPLHFVRFF